MLPPSGVMNYAWCQEHPLHPVSPPPPPPLLLPPLIIDRPTLTSKLAPTRTRGQEGEEQGRGIRTKAEVPGKEKKVEGKKERRKKKNDD